MGSIAEVPVCIVGAGPVGMSLAARLASFGIPSVLLEANADLVREGSKACLIQGDALEVLDKFGCAAQIRSEGVTWHIGNTYVRDRLIRREVYEERIGFGPFINISQYRIEQILQSFLHASPICDLRFSHCVVSARQDSDSVTVEGDSPSGPFTLRARYLVACDGVRSGLRDLFKVTLAGYTHRDLFLITDVQADLPLAKERHFYLDPSFNRGRQVVMHPQPDSIWRIDIQLPPDWEIPGRQMEPGVPVPSAVYERLRMVLDDTPYEVRWWSTYRFHQRVVERFSVGRVFFAGDAAHALPPYGARGMNSGIQDADNLAWKLALVLDGLANEDLLNSYHAERRPAAEENLAVTEKTIRFMVPPSASRQLVRKVILCMANRTSLANSRVNSGRMAEPFVYRSSPIIDRRPDQNMTGRLAPDGWLRSVGGQKIRLRRYLGRCFTIIAFIENVSEYHQLVALSHAITPLPITMLAIALTDSVELSAQDGLPLVKATEQLCAEFYVVGPCWMLVRPDGHVAAALPATPEESAVRAALSRCGRLLGAATSSLKSCS